MVKILDDIFNLFFPETCMNCGIEVEKSCNLLCFSCLSDLPLTHFSFIPKNRLENSFRGRIPVISASALLYFHKKGMVQQLVHQLKYHNRQNIGTYFGDWLGEEMIRSGRFESIDMIVPVPLHPDKEKKRGYNQVTTFAESLSRKIEAPMVPDLLVKVSGSVTQTHKNRVERALNKEYEFELKDEGRLVDQHLLLVDDIITSGATLEGCWAPLKQVDGIKISLASMAFTV
jgi:competence protein ComFC